MKKIFKLLLVPLIALSITLIPVSVNAESNGAASQACRGLTQLNNGVGCSTTNSNNGVKQVVKTAINILSLIVGVASVFVIILSGFRFITANGDSNTVSSARTQLLYAIVGLIIAAIAEFISREALHIGSNINGLILYYPHFRI